MAMPSGAAPIGERHADGAGARAAGGPDDGAEWFEADGLGGFASGTVGGVRTRRYHALLLTATRPPAGRAVLVNGVEAWVETAAGSFALTTRRYAPDVLHDGEWRAEPGPGGHRRSVPR